MFECASEVPTFRDIALARKIQQKFLSNTKRTVLRERLTLFVNSIVSYATLVASKKAAVFERAYIDALSLYEAANATTMPCDDNGLPHLLISPLVRYHPHILSQNVLAKLRLEKGEKLPSSVTALMKAGVLKLDPKPTLIPKKAMSVLLPIKRGIYAGTLLSKVYSRRVKLSFHNQKVHLTIVGDPVSVVSYSDKTEHVITGSFDNPEKPKLAKDAISRFDQGREYTFSLELLQQRLDKARISGELASALSMFGKDPYLMTVNAEKGIVPGLARGPRSQVTQLPLYEWVRGSKDYVIPDIVLRGERITTVQKTFFSNHKYMWPDSPYKAEGSGLDPEDYKFIEGIGRNMSLSSQVEAGTFGANEIFLAIEQLGVLASYFMEKDFLRDCTCDSSCEYCKEAEGVNYLMSLAALLSIVPAIAQASPHQDSKAAYISVIDQRTGIVRCEAKFKLSSTVEKSTLLIAWQRLQSGDSFVIHDALVNQLHMLWQKGLTNGYNITDLESAKFSPFEEDLVHLMRQEKWVRSFSSAEGTTLNSKGKLNEMNESRLRLPYFTARNRLIHHQYALLATPKILASIVHALTIGGLFRSPTYYHSRLLIPCLKLGFQKVMDLNDEVFGLLNLLMSYKATRVAWATRLVEPGKGVTSRVKHFSEAEDQYLDPDGSRDKVLAKAEVDYPWLMEILRLMKESLIAKDQNLLCVFDSLHIRTAVATVLRRIGTILGFYELPIGSVLNKFPDLIYRALDGVPLPHDFALSLMTNKLKALSPKDVDEYCFVDTINTKSAGGDNITLTGKASVWSSERKELEPSSRRVIENVRMKINSKDVVVMAYGKALLERDNWYYKGVICALNFAFRSAVNSKFRIAYLVPPSWVILTKYLERQMFSRVWLIKNSPGGDNIEPLTKVSMLLEDGISICADGSNFDAFAVLLCLSFSKILVELADEGSSFGLMSPENTAFLAHIYSLLAHRSAQFEFQKGDSDSFALSYAANTSGMPPTTMHNELVVECCYQTVVFILANLESVLDVNLEDGSWVNNLFPGLLDDVINKPDFSLRARDRETFPVMLKNVHSWGDDVIVKLTVAAMEERSFSKTAAVVLAVAYTVCGMKLKRAATTTSRYCGNYLQYFYDGLIGRRQRSLQSERNLEGSGLSSFPVSINSTLAVESDDSSFSRNSLVFITLIPLRCRIDSSEDEYYRLTDVDISRFGLISPSPFPRIWLDRLLGLEYTKGVKEYANLQKNVANVYAKDWTVGGTIGGHKWQSKGKGLSSLVGFKTFTDPDRLLSSERVKKTLEGTKSWDTFIAAYGYSGRHQRALDEAISSRLSQNSIRIPSNESSLPSSRSKHFKMPSKYNVKMLQLPPLGEMPIGVNSKILYLGQKGEVLLRSGMINVTFKDELISSFAIGTFSSLQHSSQQYQLLQLLVGAGARLRSSRPIIKSYRIGASMLSQKDILDMLRSSRIGAISGGFTVNHAKVIAALQIAGFVESDATDIAILVEKALVCEHFDDLSRCFLQSITEIVFNQDISRMLAFSCVNAPSIEDRKYGDEMLKVLADIMQCAYCTSILDFYSQSYSVNVLGERVPLKLPVYLASDRILASIPEFSIVQR